MNILLDTNIIIDLNDLTKPLDPRLAQMQRLLNQLSYHIFVHPNQVDDFKRDNNIQRQKINLSRLSQYNCVSAPPIPTMEDLRSLNWNQNTDNDRIDNLLLYALKSGVVHILVTNDLRLLRKARRAGIEDRVHRIEQFIVFLEKQLGIPFNIPLGIKEKFLYELQPKSKFWDSLRESYSEFDNWFSKVSQEHRKAWSVFSKSEELLAVCAFKEENNPPVTDDKITLAGKTLKICTFKVSEEFRGRKLGERLLYTAFKYAIEGRYEFIYTHTHSQDKLIELCHDFGFTDFGLYKNDIVLVKKMNPPISGIDKNLSVLEYAKLYYPFFCDSQKVKKFIIPIQQKYHEELFPDISNESESLFADQFSFDEPHRNTIKKAYISHAKVKKISPGDILLFYRTNDRRSIEVIGIVENVQFSDNLEETIALVSKRTVYSNQQLQDLLSKKILIILFRMVKYISPIQHNRFAQTNIKEPIQTIREISSAAYEQLIREQ